MHRLLSVFVVLVVFATAGNSKQSLAASTYSANATAFLSFTESSANGLGQLSYLGSSLSYSASAQASFDNGVKVSLDDASFTKTLTATPFDTLLSGDGTLGNLLTVPTDKTFEFDAVEAITDEAEGFGSGTAGDDGAQFKLEAKVNGSAFDTGDPSFGNSKVRWDLSITFQNTGLEAMTAIWTVQHFLDAAANADPKGTAFATATFEAQGADAVNNGAGDPPIPPNPQNGNGLIGNPPLLSGTTFFNFSLAVNEIKTLTLAVQARGNATIVPLPASGLLFLAGLVFLAMVRSLGKGSYQRP